MKILKENDIVSILKTLICQGKGYKTSSHYERTVSSGIEGRARKPGVEDGVEIDCVERIVSGLSELCNES